MSGAGGDVRMALVSAHVDAGSAARCVALVERCAAKFMRTGGGALMAEQPHSSPRKKRGPRRKEGA